MLIVDTAMQIAFRAHHGQTNQHDGEPYILHVHRVAIACKVENEIVRAVAWLHDSVEDSNEITLSYLDASFSDARIGLTPVSPMIVSAVDAISKRKGESLEDYYTRVSANKIATTVKLHDIRDNFRRNHLIQNEDTRLRMARKYSLGMDILT